jgi:hypothetical protein
MQAEDELAAVAVP